MAYFEAQRPAAVNPRYIFPFQGEVAVASAERTEILMKAIGRLCPRHKLLILFLLAGYPAVRVKQLLGLTQHRYQTDLREAVWELKLNLLRMGIRRLSDLV